MTYLNELSADMWAKILAAQKLFTTFGNLSKYIPAFAGNAAQTTHPLSRKQKAHKKRRNQLFKAARRHSKGKK